MRGFMNPFLFLVLSALSAAGLFSSAAEGSARGAALRSANPAALVAAVCLLPTAHAAYQPATPAELKATVAAVCAGTATGDKADVPTYDLSFKGGAPRKKLTLMRVTQDTKNAKNHTKTGVQRPSRPQNGGAKADS